jgi:hypothetical protein
VKAAHLISSDVLRAFVGQPEPGMPGAKRAVLGAVEGHATYTQHAVRPMWDGASSYRCECGAEFSDRGDVLVHMVVAPSIELLAVAS